MKKAVIKTRGTVAAPSKVELSWAPIIKISSLIDSDIYPNFDPNHNKIFWIARDSI